MQGSSFSALLLADSRAPTGAYTYSSGLEPAVMVGLTAQGVYPYMLARLATVTRLECASCVLAHRLASKSARVAAYKGLEQAVDARTPSAAQRAVSRSLGRALLRLGQSLKLTDAGLEMLGSLDAPPTRGTAFGVLGHALDMDEAACAEVCCYEDLQGVAAAALKLLPVTPATVTRWVLDARARVAEVVAEARTVYVAHALPAPCAPWMEFYAEQHALRTRRLFHA